MSELMLVFSVPPIVFPVVIVLEKPLDDAGRPVLAHVRTYEPQIAIWAGLDGQNRENALRHELWHVWEWQYQAEGMATEQRCQLYANASQHFDQEYARQGGLAALAAMRPADELLDAAADFDAAAEGPAGDGLGGFRGELRLEPIDDGGGVDVGGQRRWGTAHRRDCYGCGAFVWGDAIVNLKPPYFLKAVDGRPVDGFVIDRACVCPSCGAMQEWVEGVGPDGQPNCVAVDEPRLTTPGSSEGRAKIAAFLAAPRKACAEKTSSA